MGRQDGIRDDSRDEQGRFYDGDQVRRPGERRVADIIVAGWRDVSTDERVRFAADLALECEG